MIYRIYATRDTFVANKDGTVDASLANAGASEILNLYRTVDGHTTSTILIDFDRTQFPSTGTASSSLTLHMFDAQHASSLPTYYSVAIAPLEQNWSEGSGQDIDFYTDAGAANWLSSSTGQLWVTPGAFPTGTLSATVAFALGHEDLLADVSSIVAPYGYHVSIKTADTDLYIKKFHSRNTHFQTKRPFLELRWTDWTGSLTSRQHFVATSGAWSGSYIDARLSGVMSGVFVSTYDVDVDPTGVLNFSMYNLKTTYQSSEVPVLRLITRKKDWNPATVLTASSYASSSVIQRMYYRVCDDLSGEELVPFGTGALDHTRMSYDDEGNYFRFYMGCLPTGSVYRFDILYYIDGDLRYAHGADYNFKFRVF